MLDTGYWILDARSLLSGKKGNKKNKEALMASFVVLVLSYHTKNLGHEQK
jgi:hypothetical protein